MSGFKLIIGSEFDKGLGPVPWVVEGLIESNTVGVLFGGPGSHKTTVAIEWALHTAAGLGWNGKRVTQGPVIYITGEDHGRLARRQEAWLVAHNVSDAELPLWWSKTPARFMDPDAMAMVVEAVDAVANEPGGTAPALIVIDTLASNFGVGNPRSSRDMNLFLNSVEEHLMRRHGAAVLIVHDTGHLGRGYADGNQALLASVDFVYQVERAPGVRMVKMSCTKVRDHAAWEPERHQLQAGMG